MLTALKDFISNNHQQHLFPEIVCFVCRDQIAQYFNYNGLARRHGGLLVGPAKFAVVHRGTPFAQIACFVRRSSIYYHRKQNSADLHSYFCLKWT